MPVVPVAVVPVVVVVVVTVAVVPVAAVAVVAVAVVASTVSITMEFPGRRCLHKFHLLLRRATIKTLVQTEILY